MLKWSRYYDIIQKATTLQESNFTHLAYDQHKVDKYNSFKISSRWSKFIEKRHDILRFLVHVTSYPRLPFIYLFIYNLLSVLKFE
jgi:hypothetical protein